MSETKTNEKTKQKKSFRDSKLSTLLTTKIFIYIYLYIIIQVEKDKKMITIKIVQKCLCLRGHLLTWNVPQSKIFIYIYKKKINNNNVINHRRARGGRGSWRPRASPTTDLHLVGAGNKVRDTSSHKLLLYWNNLMVKTVQRGRHETQRLHSCSVTRKKNKQKMKNKINREPLRCPNTHLRTGILLLLGVCVCLCVATRWASKPMTKWPFKWQYNWGKY